MSDESGFFPDMITKLPEADAPATGIRRWLFQGEEGQITFIEAQPGIAEKPHSHGDQWQVLLDGEITIYVDGKPHRMTKGDSMFIPAGVVHYGTIDKVTHMVTYFADAHRYRPRRST